MTPTVSAEHPRSVGCPLSAVPLAGSTRESCISCCGSAFPPGDEDRLKLSRPEFLKLQESAVRQLEHQFRRAGACGITLLPTLPLSAEAWRSTTVKAIVRWAPSTDLPCLKGYLVCLLPAPGCQENAKALQGCCACYSCAQLLKRVCAWASTPAA